MLGRSVKAAREFMGKTVPGLKPYHDKVENYFYAEKAMRGSREMLVFNNKQENKPIGFWMRHIGDDPYYDSYCQLFLTATKEKFNESSNVQIEHNRLILTFGMKSPDISGHKETGLDIKAIFLPEELLLFKPEKVLIKNSNDKWQDLDSYSGLISNKDDQSTFLESIQANVKSSVCKMFLFGDATEYHSPKLSENPYLNQKIILALGFHEIICTPNTQIAIKQKDKEGKTSIKRFTYYPPQTVEK